MLQEVVNARIKRRYNWIVSGEKWEISKEFKDNYQKFYDYIVSLGVDNDKKKYIHLIDKNKACEVGNIQLLGYPLKPSVTSIKYGETEEDRKTRLFSIFKTLHNTLNPVGGLLVDVCSEWKGPNGYPTFSKWAFDNGYNDKLFIEWNGIGNISPDTALIVTKKKKIYYNIEFDGKTYSMTELASKYGLTYKTLVYRLRQGRTMKQALGLKYHKRDVTRGQSAVTFRGESMSLVELSEKYKINHKVVYWRVMKLGWDIEEALEIKARARRKTCRDLIGKQFTTKYGDKLMVLSKATKKGDRNPLYNCIFLTGPDTKTIIQRAPENIERGNVRNRFKISNGAVGVLGETVERKKCPKKVADKLLIKWTDSVRRKNIKICKEWYRYSKFHNFVVTNLDLDKFVDSSYMLDYRLIDAFSKKPSGLLNKETTCLIPSYISQYLNRSPFCCTIPMVRYKNGYRVLFTTKRRKTGSVRLSLGMYKDKVQALAVQFSAHSKYLREMISQCLKNNELPDSMLVYHWEELYHFNKTLDKKIKQYLVNNPLSKEINDRIDRLVLASLEDRLEVCKDKVGL